MASLSVAAATVLISLAGTEWGPQTDEKPERFIHFKETNVSGSGGCNRFMGGYTFEGGAIKIGPLASTRMACAPAIMAAEDAWFDILNRAAFAEATAATLVLKDGNGTILGALRRRDRD